MSEIHARISALCKEKGITINKMCKEAGVSASVLSDLKTGRQTGLNAKTADKIAQYFGVSVSYILGTGADAPEIDPMNEYLQQIKDNPGQRLLFDKTKNATPEQLQAIVSMIDAFMQK